METHGLMWQFLLSRSNREALLMKRYAVTLRDAPHRRRHSSESVTGFLNKRVPGSVMNMRFASILSLLVRATSLRSRPHLTGLTACTCHSGLMASEPVLFGEWSAKKIQSSIESAWQVILAAETESYYYSPCHFPNSGTKKATSAFLAFLR